MYVLAVAAIIFYMSKVPERYFPGTLKFKCDTAKEISCDGLNQRPHLA